METASLVAELSNDDLLAATCDLVGEGCGIEARLLVHLAEIDERKLYLERACPSMFAFCVERLGFSEDAAYSRILVARAGRKLPELFQALGSGRVHLTGLRLLAPHLTEENHREVLAQAVGKSKREIEELVAAIAPQPPVPATIRKLPHSLRAAAPEVMPLLGSGPASATDSSPATHAQSTPAWVAEPANAAEPVAAAPRHAQRPAVVPLSADTFKVQFSVSRGFRDKLRHAQDLLRHRIPGGDIAAIMERALDLLIAQVEKERFAVGRKGPQVQSRETPSRHIPDAIKREVWQRDGGRCTYTDGQGRRCNEAGALVFEHEEGFARTHRHDVKGSPTTWRAADPPDRVGCGSFWRSGKRNNP